MELFLDTANVAAITQWVQTGLIDGITTNPTLLSKEESAPLEQIKKIMSIIGHRGVSVEVTETDPQLIYQQAKRIAAIGPNVIVKIPCHVSYYEVIRKLTNENIALNITLVFTLAQGLFMSKLGVKYISPFIGRLDDIDVDGVALLRELQSMKKHYHFSTKILAASIRSVRHLHNVINAGVDIATIPQSVLAACSKHMLTDQGIEKFMDDWGKLNISQFP